MANPIVQKRALAIGGAAMMAAGPTIAAEDGGGWFGDFFGALVDEPLGGVLFLLGAVLVVYAFRHNLLAMVGIQTDAHLERQVRAWLDNTDFRVRPRPDFIKEHPEVKFAFELEERDEDSNTQRNFMLFKQRDQTVLNISAGLKFVTDADRAGAVPTPDEFATRAFRRVLVLALMGLGHVSAGFRQIDDWVEGRVVVGADVPVSILDEYQFTTLVHLARRAHAVGGVLMSDHFALAEAAAVAAAASAAAAEPSTEAD